MMKRFYKNLTCVAASFCLVGCVSQTTVAIDNLDPNHPHYHSEDCMAYRDTQLDADTIKYARTIFSPIVVFASGGVLLPFAAAANAGWDYNDRDNANELNKACGVESKDEHEIFYEVMANAAVSALTGTILPSVPQTATTTK